jgi:hypothetical protein
VHFAVTSHPTAEWTAQQLRHAFPWDTTPRYLLRDRDGSYGEPFPQTARAMNIQEVLTAPRSPWQNAYVERLIGSIRRRLPRPCSHVQRTRLVPYSEILFRIL